MHTFAKKMDALQAIVEHRSVRKYKSDPISEDILNTILEAGMRGANTGNMQLYSIVVTTDPAIKEQLLPLHFNQSMVKDAPVLLTFCVDVYRFSRWCEISETEPGYDNFLMFMLASIDATIVAQNCSIVAESFGLGTCYLGTTLYNAQEMVQVLKLPQGVFPLIALTVGYPAEIPEKTDRLPFDAVVHKETYHLPSDDEIASYFAQKENSPFYQQFVREHQLRNLAEVFTKIRYKQEDNITFSKKLLTALLKMGFMNQ